MALERTVENEDDEFQKALAERQLARQNDAMQSMVEHDAKIEAHLITTAMISPRVLPDPDEHEETPPDGAVFLWQIPQLERAALVVAITRLMAGLDAVERRIAAIKAASFREEHDGGADDAPVPETEAAERVVGDQ